MVNNFYVGSLAPVSIYSSSMLFAFVLYFSPFCCYPAWFTFCQDYYSDFLIGLPTSGFKPLKPDHLPKAQLWLAAFNT
jgi:hypothetical protein